MKTLKPLFHYIEIPLRIIVMAKYHFFLEVKYVVTDAILAINFYREHRFS